MSPGDDYPDSVALGIARNPAYFIFIEESFYTSFNFFAFPEIFQLNIYLNHSFLCKGTPKLLSCGRNCTRRQAALLSVINECCDPKNVILLAVISKVSPRKVFNTNEPF